MGEERELGLVGELQLVEDQHQLPPGGHPLKQRSPGGEQLALRDHRVRFAEPEQPVDGRCDAGARVDVR
jgi:hypothetical protein